MITLAKTPCFNKMVITSKRTSVALGVRKIKLITTNVSVDSHTVLPLLEMSRQGILVTRGEVLKSFFGPLYF